MGCSGVLWDVPGVFRGCSGLFWGVPGIFRGVPGCSRAVPGFTDTLNRPPGMHHSFELSNERPHLRTKRFDGKILSKDKSLDC